MTASPENVQAFDGWITSVRSTVMGAVHSVREDDDRRALWKNALAWLHR
jgi:hypothetical protein